MNRRLMARRIVSLVFLAVLLMTACQQTVPLPVISTSPNIGDIRGAPTTYEGKTVTIEGEYLGWKGGYGSPPVTRSDWLVQDATGWLYVTGKPSGLDPLHDVGHPIKVTGLVKTTKDGEPYLYAQEIEVPTEKTSALLLLQIGLRKKQLTNPIPERLEQMKVMGMRIESLDIQRIFIHFAEEPTTQQIDELKTIGITSYLDSWIPPASGHPAGFIVADMPVDKLSELVGKQYVVWLDTAEQEIKPQAEQIA